MSRGDQKINDVSSFSTGTNTCGLNILSLNACSLKNKIIYPNFVDFVSNYDIIGFQETKTDSLDTINFPNYSIHYKHRKEIARVKSGGIGIAYKRQYERYIRFIDTDSKLVQWFEISKRLTKTSDILCGVVYIPPENSLYANKDPFFEINEEYNLINDKYSSILLLGDFNSRTKMLKDYIEIDETIFHENDMDGACEELNHDMSFFSNSNSNVLLTRNNKDHCTNNYGYKLIDFCKLNSLYIIIGRTKGDIYGSPTCRETSCVDYFICSLELLYFVNSMHVHDFCSILSDVHNANSTNCVKEPVYSLNSPNNNVRLWDSDKVEHFKAEINAQDVGEIFTLIQDVESKSPITQNDINFVFDKNSKVFITCAEISFGKNLRSENHIGNNKEPSWYGSECKHRRKKWHQARHTYKTVRSEVNKTSLNNASKMYKNTMKKHYVKFKRNNVKRLRNLKNSCPKKYWQIINGNKTEATSATLENFHSYFKKVNSGQTQEVNNPNVQSNEFINNEQTQNEFINQPFTIEEIQNAIKCLKNNKACGFDSVLNEHIKSTCNTLCPLYEKMFNIVLNTGILPESWTLGLIKPIYKQKGDKADPSNYRPITLLSCMGKLFTTVLNNRLNKYAENIDLISSSQAGFRKGYSTLDNMFILYSLIEMLYAKKKKLFCAFIDLKQAFDTVWRDGLWQKLTECNINGKCYDLIKNMYSNIKSCVMVNGDKTNFFNCNVGLRQGENLSPFLFTVFLNDLESFFFRNNTNGGIECLSSELDDSIYVYLKLFIILYADDTVIVSETQQGLQSALHTYHEYCNEWRLTVNTDKSKIVVFSKGRQQNYCFYFNNSVVEVVKEYKYLGVLFSRSGSFYAAKNHVSSQAQKTMYSLIKKSKSLALPVDLQIELFDKMVKPILLYGSEIWGFGKLDVEERTF